MAIHLLGALVDRSRHLAVDCSHSGTQQPGNFLCEVAFRSGVSSTDGPASCPFPFTQPMIAETLGLTPVHVNRTFRVLRERGLADVTRGSIDEPALQETAGEDEPGRC